MTDDKKKKYANIADELKEIVGEGCGKPDCPNCGDVDELIDFAMKAAQAMVADLRETKMPPVHALLIIKFAALLIEEETGAKVEFMKMEHQKS